MSEEKQNVLRNLKTLRKANNFTQKQIADLLGVDRSTYAYYESGKSKPNFDVIQKLVQIYQVDYKVIIGNEDALDQPEFDDITRDMMKLSDEEKELVSRFRIMKRTQKESLLRQLGITPKVKKSAEKESNAEKK